MADAVVRARTGFMPLFPLTVRVLMTVTGVRDFFWVATIFSNVCSYAALLLAYRWARKRLRVPVEFLEIFCLTAGTFYLSIPYTEGLFLLLVAAVLALTARQRYLWAAVLSGFAGATRIHGIALIVLPAISLIVDTMQEGGVGRSAPPGRGRTLMLLVSMGVLAAAPLGLFMLYTSGLVGDSLAFFSAQRYWNNPTPYPFQAVIGLVRTPRTMSHLLHGALWLLYVVLLVRNWRRMRAAETAFCAAILLISSTTEVFYGTYRHVLPLLPLYVAIAEEEAWVRKVFVWTNLVLGTVWLIAFVTRNRITV